MRVGRIGAWGALVGLTWCFASSAAVRASRFDDEHGQSVAGPKESADALAREVRALLADGRAGAQSTLDLALRALRITEQQGGSEYLAVATALDALGATHAARGEYTAAIPVYERAVAIRTRNLPAADPRSADSFDGLANALMRLERLEPAEAAIKRSILIREAHSRDEPLALADTLELVAMLSRFRGDFAAARVPLGRALEIRQALTPIHAATASLLNLAGELAFLTGDLKAAHQLFSDTVALARRTLRPEHPAISLYVRRLALTHFAFGDLPQAMTLRQEAVRIAETSMASCDLELAGALSALASSLTQAAEYTRARQLHERALNVVERCLGPGHSVTATYIYNLAELAGMMGEFAEFERLARRAARLWARSLGGDHPFVARANDLVARSLASRGQQAQARALLGQTLAVRRKALGPAHPDVAETLQNLARISNALGQPARALRYLDEAETIYAKAGAADDADPLERLLELRGLVYRQRGDLSAARRSIAEALELRVSRFGRTHPTVAATLATLAAVDFDMASFASALQGALEAEENGRAVLRSTIRSLPERQSLAFAGNRPTGLATAISVAARDASHATAVYDALIRSRGVVLDELAARAQAVATLDRDHDPVLVAAVDARQRYANLLVRSFDDPASVAKERLDEARAQQEASERVLAEQNEGVRIEQARERIGLEQVRDALPAGSALVSIARYERSGTAAAYLAFVTRAGSADVQVVPLGGADSLDAAIQRWRDEVSGRSLVRGTAPAVAVRQYRQAGAQLRARLWDPVAGHLVGVTRVFIVPDGAVNLVTFAALPSTSGRHLLEDAPPIHYAATERDLVRVGTSPVASGRGLLAIGGAAFDDATTQPPSRQRTLRQFACDSFGALRFEPLPATSREVDDIATIWTTEATVLRGAAAGERALKDTIAGRRVIHFATHGFLLGSTCTPAPQGTRAVGGLTAASPRTPRNENPLLLAGLALAGANRRSGARPDEEDGILTAEEVTGLNLQGTEWAVLSACDTGLGQVRAGEGVFGLRRAFQIAGVRTVIMSLWSVEDEATRTWMRALYEGRLHMNLDTADAVRHASLSVLAERRARGQSTHPFYWAAFVAAGDWR